MKLEIRTSEDHPRVTIITNGGKRYDFFGGLIRKDEGESTDIEFVGHKMLPMNDGSRVMVVGNIKLVEHVGKVTMTTTYVGNQEIKFEEITDESSK